MTIAEIVIVMIVAVIVDIDSEAKYETVGSWV